MKRKYRPRTTIYSIFSPVEYTRCRFLGFFQGFTIIRILFCIFQGLADLIYGNQPSFSLVSNGAEVIKLDKRLYEDNASQRLMSDLRERVSNYIIILLVIYSCSPR